MLHLQCLGRPAPTPPLTFPTIPPAPCRAPPPTLQPAYLKPASTTSTRRFKITVRLNKSSSNKCQDLTTLCGGDTCMVALSDEEYNTCPAFYSQLMA